MYEAVGDPTLADRQRRFEFIAEARSHVPPVSYDTIAELLANMEGGEKLSRQAIHKIWSRGLVRPNGRPSNPTKKRADLEERILKAHSRRLELLGKGRAKDDPAVARIDERIESLQTQLVSVK